MQDFTNEELLDEIIIMLMAALSLAGVRDNKINEALESYENAMEQIDDDVSYDYKAVCDIILNLKKTKKELFKSI